MNISPQGRQVSVIRGLGLSITALKSRGRPQPTSTLDSLPTVGERVTCRNTTPALQGSQHELLACDNTRNKLFKRVQRKQNYESFYWQITKMIDNLQFKKEEQTNHVNGLGTVRARYNIEKLRRQDIRPVLKLTLLREVQFCASSLKTRVPQRSDMFSLTP